MKIFVLVFLVSIGSCVSEKECYPEIQNILNKIELNEEIDLTKINSCGNSNKKETPLALLRAIVLIYKDSLVLPELHQDSNLLEIAKVLQWVNAKNEHERLIRINKLLNSTTIQNQFPFEFNYLLSYSNEKNRFAALHFVLAQNPKEISNLDLHYLLKIIENLCGRNGLDVNLEMKLAIIHYGLYLSSTAESITYKRTKANLYLRLGSILMQESEDYNDLVLTSFKRAESIYRSIGEKGYEKFSNWFATISSEKDYSEITIANLDEMNIKRSEKLSFVSDIGTSLLESDPQLAINYFNYGLQLIDGIQCSNTKTLLLNYLGEAYFNKGDFLNATHSFEFAKIKNNCPRDIEYFQEYLNILLSTDLLSKLEGPYNLDKFLSLYNRERELARIILKDNHDHLLDYYVVNARKVFKAHKNQYVQDEEQISELLRLLNLTSIRSQKLVQKREDRKTAEKRKTNKLDWLREINNFKDTTDYKKKVYRDLFRLIVKNHDPSPKIKPIETTFSPSSIIKNVKEKQAQLLGFLAFDGQYMAYHYSFKGLNIYDIDSEALDSISTLFNENMHKEKSIERYVRDLRQILLPMENLENVIPLVILPDANLNLMPWHLVLPSDQKNILAIDISTATDWEQIIIDKSKSAVYSYSNQESLNSDVRRERTELKYGFNEAKKIATGLGGTDSRLFAGENFTKANFFNGLQKDLIHISSHSSSDFNNKLNNYVVVENNAGKSEKVYAYEIESVGESPIVVILSACNSGTGHYKNGTGIYSISRSFAQNGASAIIKSIYEVYDKPTETFMTKLYENWTSGRSLGESLDSTRSFFKKQPNSHPIHWAGFVLEGNPNIYLK